jgi:hypothetical protein
VKDVYEVLRKKEMDFRRIQRDIEMLHRILSQKELESQRVQKEIAAFHSVIPLLAEDTDLVECEPVLPPSCSFGGKKQSRTGS